ncbi:helix-turn-helix domain-containing protein [Pseudovibrio exalbescens]|uniref:helix-turn-helix domain-containing protein n=1 Tax=Pseudovibrio exalbescens TaxID=197461 RepID=UPI002366C188|nr:helix-turn-helix domain-containing protein [Pseudovibrio exalbescens]MDD7910169.1 helix-turn-helix domain-containing protein [Pseudovibrio exalbescens]
MKVKELRQQKGLSQEQLAEMAGVSTRTLQRIENGANPSTETLKCLASALEINFADLRETPHMTHPDTHENTEPTPAMLAAVRAYDAKNEQQETVNSFKGHLSRYLIVMAVLTLINLVTNPDYFWVVWPALGWGIAIAFHAWDAFMVKRQVSSSS